MPDTDDLAPTGAPTIDAAHFRAVLGHFASGIVIVTGMDGSEPVGLTCQSFFSVSLEPPLVAFSPSRTSKSWPRIQGSGAFCVNLLAAEQEELCRLFAQSGADKFRGIGWQVAASGSPLQSSAAAPPAPPAGPCSPAVLAAPSHAPLNRASSVCFQAPSPGGHCNTYVAHAAGI